MTINKTETNKSVVELRKELSENGTTIENVYVDGKKFCCVGYVSEADKEACLKAIQSAIDGSENMYDAMAKLMANANLTDANIEPDEEIMIGELPMVISYRDKAIYDLNGEEFVNCRELTSELPNEACKTILLQRAEIALNTEI